MKTNLKLKPNSNRCDFSHKLSAQRIALTSSNIFFVNLRLVLVLLLNEVWVGLGVAGTIIYFFYSQLAWQHDNNNSSNHTPDCLCSKVVRGPNGAMTQSRFTSGSVRVQINRLLLLRSRVRKPHQSHSQVTVKLSLFWVPEESASRCLSSSREGIVGGYQRAHLTNIHFAFLLLCCDDSIELNRAQWLPFEMKQ